MLKVTIGFLQLIDKMGLMDSFLPLILPILIAQLRSADFLKFDMGQVYVMIAFSILPVILVYLILSKHIVEGAAVGAVKG